MSRILTPAQVAELLQVSERSVMRHAKELGGFYPGGIRVLRFMESDVLTACRGGVIVSRIVTRPTDDRDPGRHGL